MTLSHALTLLTCAVTYVVKKVGGLVLWAPKISIVSLGLLWSNVENPDIIPIKTFLLGKEGKSLDELSYHTLFYAMEVVGLGLMAPTRETGFYIKLKFRAYNKHSPYYGMAPKATPL